MPVNSSVAYKGSGAERNNLRVNHGFFVMNLYRDMYVAPHGTPRAFPKFHSTIPQGTAVQCSGSILIVKGEVREITSASGHYKPDKLFFVNVLEQLKTVGVKRLNQIALYDYSNKLIAKNAADYLKQYGRWKSVDERGRIISAARKGEASAIRGEIYTKRLKELGVGRTKDQALEALFAEVFRKELQHGPGGVTAWTKTWQGVLDDLITFSGEDMMRNNKDSDWKWYTEKKIQYQSRPPVPPKPSVPRFAPV